MRAALCVCEEGIRRFAWTAHLDSLFVILYLTLIQLVVMDPIELMEGVEQGHMHKRSQMCVCVPLSRTLSCKEISA